MMTTRRLWHMLLVERSPFPLFIRLAPRAHRPADGSVWRFLAWYTFLGLYASILLAPFMFRSVTLGVLFVVFGSPAFIVMIGALAGSPFVVFGGAFFGVRFANRTSTALATLQRNAMTDVLRATPPGRWGLLRAVAAATLRRRGIFFGAGVYEMTQAHLALAFGLAFPVGIVLVLGVASQFLDLAGFSPDGGNAETRVIFVAGFVAMGALPPLLALLLHLDFRSALILGVTAGIFGGTVTLERADPWTGSLAVLIGVLVPGVLLMVGTVTLTYGIARPPFDLLAAVIALPIGWGVALLLREWALSWLWRRIATHEELPDL